MVEKWTAAFENGSTELAELPRSGRPRASEKVNAVRALVGAEGHFSQKNISQRLGYHHETMKYQLRNDLNMQEVNCEWAPQTLDIARKAARVEISRELLDLLKGPTTEVCVKCTPGTRRGHILIIIGRLCG
jgi:hypothetical protein